MKISLNKFEQDLSVKTACETNAAFSVKLIH